MVGWARVHALLAAMKVELSLAVVEALWRMFDHSQAPKAIHHGRPPPLMSHAHFQ